MTLLGEVDVEFELNLDGHRDFFVTWLVETDNKWVGPSMVLNCPGLPTIGTAWKFGPEGSYLESDEYAICQGYAKVTPKVTAAPNFWWLIRQQFSTRPFDRLNDIWWTTPFVEKEKVRGSFVKKTEEGVFAKEVYCVENGIRVDMLSSIIRNTSWQQFKGKNVEFDRSIPRVLISKNIPDQGNNILFYQSAINHVNEKAMWGFEPRTVKLDDVSLDRMVYGNGQYFFVVNFEFEIDQIYDHIEKRFYSGHDRRIANEGTKEIISENSDKDNPAHFKAIKAIPDRERSKSYLTSGGKAIDRLTSGVIGGTAWPTYINVEYLPSTDFILKFGIPGDI